MANRLTVRRETHELKILARPQVRSRAFCRGCHKKVRWLLPEEAMALAGTGLREVFRLIEAGDYHYIESSEGFLLVCAESLAARADDQLTR